MTPGGILMFSVLRKVEPRARLRVTTPLGVGRFGRQDVHELVHRVSRMALDPRKAHVAFSVEDDREELLPQVAVGDRFTLGVLPAPPQPPDVPLVVEALHHVRGVADDLYWTLHVLAQR